MIFRVQKKTFFPRDELPLSQNGIWAGASFGPLNGSNPNQDATCFKRHWTATTLETFWETFFYVWHHNRDTTEILEFDKYFDTHRKRIVPPSLGRDEMGCLSSTKKKAVVYIDHYFYLVNVDHPAFFNLVDVDHCLFHGRCQPSCLFQLFQPAFF